MRNIRALANAMQCHADLIFGVLRIDSGDLVGSILLIFLGISVHVVCARYACLDLGRYRALYLLFAILTPSSLGKK